MKKPHRLHQRFDEGVMARVDKWVWAVRILKTRTMATKHCDKGMVTVNDAPAKASRKVKIGDVVSVRKAGFPFTFEVLGIIDKQMDKQMAEQCCLWLNEAEFLQQKANKKQNAVIQTMKGEDRANMTKKDKRIIADMKQLWE